MADQVWYRSLYWRIAFGFVLLVAVLLGAQGLVFLWLTGRTSELLPGRTPAELAQVIAADAATVLQEHPETDLQTYLTGRYSSAFRSWVLVMKDGPTIASRRIAPPPNVARAARSRLLGGAERGGRGFGGYRSDRSGSSASPPDAGSPGGRTGFGRGGPNQILEFAPVRVNDATVGMVAVPLEPPPLFVTLRGLGPTFAAAGLVLLVIGTAVAALVVFRPAHRRLRALQQAAMALGTGHTAVRATEAGGDEVASLAHTFNEMAAGLESRAAALTAADRARRQLLADISHELATPLAAIRGYVETLSMSNVPLDDDTRRRYLAVVSDETERLEHIIGDLLDLARVEGGTPLRSERVAIAGLFERVRQRHEPVLAQKGLTLETRLVPDVLEVTGDGTRLEQALQNLVANAVRHTPEGGLICVEADWVSEGVRLVVEDTGPGIPEEHLPRLFDRFYKVDVSRTGTALPSGSGLGLSIVHAIIERHGGRISASNRPGGGARFEIVLPCYSDTGYPQGSSKLSKLKSRERSS